MPWQMPKCQSDSAAKSAVHACKGTAVQRTVQQKDANAINVAILLKFAGHLHSRDGQNLSHSVSDCTYTI